MWRRRRMTGYAARHGAVVDGYPFDVRLLHWLPSTGLPARIPVGTRVTPRSRLDPSVRC
jgi:hypothetical protein